MSPQATRLQQLQALRTRVEAAIADELVLQRKRLAARPKQPAPGVVRSWARSVGYRVSETGRVPADVLDAYLQAHPEERA